MPQNRHNLEKPPEAMTWRKASLVLILAIIFDALRFMCQQLWFFGPVIVALYCNAKVGGWFGSVWGLTATACTAGATALGIYGLPVIATLGVIMAMALGLIGWLIIGFITITTNRRIFAENPANTLWFVGSLLVSEVPFIGALPAFTGTMWRLYHVQIQKEQAALKIYEKEVAETKMRERKQQAAEFMQARTVQTAQMQEQIAANDERYAEQEAIESETMQEDDGAANDAEYIPDDVRRAA